MEDLSLHLLDIVENSIAAQAKNIRILIREDRTNDLFSLEIIDDGRGMDRDSLNKALDPFFTTKTTRRFGFGLSLLAQAAEDANGRFSIESAPGQGTGIRAVFQASHIDMKPLGDIPQTMVTLIMGNPLVHFYYSHKMNQSEYELDTAEIKAQLNGISINSPDVLHIIKKNIIDGLANLRRSV